MRKSIAVLVAVGVVITAAWISPTASADSAAIEVALLASINTGRAGIGKPALLMHNGLRQQEHTFAQHLSQIHTLTHDGFMQRAHDATPDPTESNGAPDDGFTGFIAENVAQNVRGGRTDAQVADSVYQQWLNSPGHKANMFDESNSGYNAAGVGIFEDPDGTIWAALELAVDTSPPAGGTTPTPTPVPCGTARRHRHHHHRC